MSERALEVFFDVGIVIVTVAAVAIGRFVTG